MKISKSKTATYWTNGQCYVYAYCFISLVGGIAVSYQRKKDLSGHIFIKFENQFFDAESVQHLGNIGLSNWKKLQPYLNKAKNKNLKRHLNKNSIIKKWGMRKETIIFCESMISKIKEGN